MELIKDLFYYPILNALIFFYNLLGDMGLAIIAITVLVKLITLPLANKATRAQRRMQALQPELKKLQEKHKDDREVLAKEMMAFYRREGVNPASSILPIVIQIPIIISLFYVFQGAVTGHALEGLYSFVAHPAKIDPTFLGLFDLSKPDRVVLPLLAAVLQFYQSKMLLPKDKSDLPAINKQLMYVFPVVTFVVAANFPAAIPLYYAVTTLFAIGQQYVIIKEMPLSSVKVAAVEDWNEANPKDAIAPGKTPGKAKKGNPSKRGSKGANVTVRKRGQ